MNPLRGEDVKLLKYADNLVLYHPNKSFEDIRAMSESIVEIQSWSDTRGLLLNSDKCKHILFRLRASSLTHSTQVPFESVTSIKSLASSFLQTQPGHCILSHCSTVHANCGTTFNIYVNSICRSHTSFSLFRCVSCRWCCTALRLYFLDLWSRITSYYGVCWGSLLASAPYLMNSLSMY